MAKHTPRPATRAIADATSKPPFRYEPGPDGARQSRSRADGFYLCRSPNYATASVAVQSRWGNLYATPAAVRSLAVDVDRRAQVIAEVATPADGPVADRLPGQEARSGPAAERGEAGRPDGPPAGRCDCRGRGSAPRPGHS